MNAEGKQVIFLLEKEHDIGIVETQGSPFVATPCIKRQHYP